MTDRKRVDESCYLVSTVLTPDERMQVDAAGIGLYRTQHRTEAKELLVDVFQCQASAIFISLRCYERSNDVVLERVVRELSRIPTFALLSEVTTNTPGALLRLGQQGIRRVIDVRSAQGWRELRQFLTEELMDEVEASAAARFDKYSGVVTKDVWKFLEVVFRKSRRVTSIRALVEDFGMLPSTLMSRFFRAGLPAPKQYLATARLVRAAYLFENQGFSVANVANHLQYSSPQSFGRHIRTMMGMTAVEFRREYTGMRMMEVFERTLVIPYVEILKEFVPLSDWVRIPGRGAKRVGGE